MSPAEILAGVPAGEMSAAELVALRERWGLRQADIAALVGVRSTQTPRD